MFWCSLEENKNYKEKEMCWCSIGSCVRVSKVLVLLPRMKLRNVFDAKTETVTVGKENNLG